MNRPQDPNGPNLLDYLHDLESEVGRLSATETQLLEALKTRETIGVAVGLLMERRGSDREQAFELLRGGSQHLNIKLRDLAEDLVAQFEQQHSTQ